MGDAAKEKIQGKISNAQSKVFVRDVGYRVAVNFGFWMAVVGGMILVEGTINHVPLIGPKESAPLSVAKIVDFADGDLWGLQIFASIFVFLIFWFMRRNKKQYRFFLACVKDELFGVCLNFGSLFVICGLYLFGASCLYVHYHKGGGDFYGFRRASVDMGFGVANILIYSIWSNFKSEDSDDASDSSDASAPSQRTQMHREVGRKSAFLLGLVAGMVASALMSRKRR